MRNTVLLCTLNQLSAHANGGCRRTLQVAECVRRLGIDVELVGRDGAGKVMRHLWGLNLLLGYRFPMLPTRRRLSNGGFELSILTHALKSHQGPRIVIWETTPNLMVPRVAKHLGFKVLGLPQNLELMKPNFEEFFTARRGPAAVRREVTELSRCAAVVAISREEQWYLNLQGVNASFLPYFPPASYVPELVELRRLRAETQKNGFLIIGTTLYPPTFDSMRAQLRYLQDNGISKRHAFIVAGWGTERFKGQVDSGIEIRGAVSQEDLWQLLKSVKGVVLQDLPSTGVLTRIPDFLVAGIPIIANEIASRSAWAYPGLHTYANIGELENLLDRDLSTPPRPERPVKEEKAFEDLLRRLI
jgi:hypothetical protein